MEEAYPNPATQRCAVVTGANKGLGLEISRQLATTGIKVILTARDEKNGIEAAASLKNSGLSNVIFHQLDVTNSVSIDSLAKFIHNRFGKLDILVNNAGLSGVILDTESLKSLNTKEISSMNQLREVLTDRKIDFKTVLHETYERAEECLKTNYYGLKGVTEALIPLLQLSDSARIVNISSSAGKLKRFGNERIREELVDLDGLTEERLDELLQKFLKDFKERQLKTNGWPTVYSVSKIWVNLYTQRLAKKFPSFCINSVHPGFVKTDMTSHIGEITAEEGAKAPVMLALLPNDGPSGHYFYGMEISSID